MVLSWDKIKNGASIDQRHGCRFSLVCICWKPALHESALWKLNHDRAKASYMIFENKCKTGILQEKQHCAIFPNYSFTFWLDSWGRGAVVACLATLNLIADELMSDLLHQLTRLHWTDSQLSTYSHSRLFLVTAKSTPFSYDERFSLNKHVKTQWNDVTRNVSQERGEKKERKNDENIAVNTHSPSGRWFSDETDKWYWPHRAKLETRVSHGGEYLKSAHFETMT